MVYLFRSFRVVYSVALWWGWWQPPARGLMPHAARPRPAARASAPWQAAAALRSFRRHAGPCSVPVGTLGPGVHKAERREAKGKGEQGRYTHLNAEFQGTARREKKAFPSDQREETEEHVQLERLEISSR